MPLPFSPAVSKNNLIFISGQIYLTDEGKLLEGTIQEQTHQIMKNLENVLKKEEVSFKNVVKTTIYVTDMSISFDVNKVYGSYLEEPYPAREMVCVKSLPLGAKLEISMIAIR